MTNKMWLKVSAVALALMISLGASPLSALAASGHGERGEFRFRVDVDREDLRPFFFDQRALRDGLVPVSLVSPTIDPDDLGLRKKIEVEVGGLKKRVEIENGIVTKLEVERDFFPLSVGTLTLGKIVEMLRTHLM